MNMIHSFEFAYAPALARTLVHFLWEGAAIGLAAVLLLRALRPAASRYAAGVAALGAMLLAPLVTFMAVLPAPSAQTSAELQGLAVLPSSAAAEQAPQPLPTSGGAAPAGDRTPANSLIIGAWLLGVAALSIRLAGGWLAARRLTRRAVRPAAPEICELARRVAARLALGRVVRFVQSTVVAVPVTLGWLKPVVLLPAAVLSGLSPAEIEALLAHELAHVRRRDYLVNLLQSAVETLLFYHPAVWWVSKIVRAEREHCCDDAAVGVCDRLVYVTALSNLAALDRPPRAALAATGGPLLCRVRRLLGPQAGEQQIGSVWLPALILLLVAGAGARIAMTSAPVPEGKAPLAGALRESAGVIQETAARPAQAAPAGQGQAGDAARRAGLQRELEMKRRALPEPAAEPAPPQAASQNAAAEARRQAEIAELEASMKLARERYERAKKLVETGLASPRTLAEIEIELATIERKLAAASRPGGGKETQFRMAELQAQLELARLRLERTRKLVEAGLATTATAAEAEAAVAALEQQLAAAGRELAVTSAELEQRRIARQAEIAEIEWKLQVIGTRRGAQLEAEAARARLDALRALAAVSERDRRLLESSTPVADAAETVRHGDLLVIDVAGEPDLPRVYAVGDNGAIRFPLIGNVQVLGLTAAQARDAVARELADRRLGQNPAITVSLRRAR